MVVHLAGENIAGRRWSAAQKRRILDSRVEGTRGLCESLAAMTAKPRVLICASAVAPEASFLSDVVERWEQACEPAVRAGIRVVNLRFGVILDPRGGALKKMLPPFRFGLGGRLGNGRQLMNWVSIEDAIGAIFHAMRDERLEGPVNVVAPQPVSNREFTSVLGGVLRRPAVAPMPGFMARLLFGEMADETLLASTSALPEELERTGFVHTHGDLGPALCALLGVGGGSRG